MMRLKLFDRLDHLAKRPNIRVGSETQIFSDYDKLVNDPNNKLIIAHCYDEVIVSQGLRKNLTRLGEDLSRNPNTHFIFISSFDIGRDLPRSDNFLFIPFIEYHGVYWDLYKDIEPSDPRKINKRFLSLNKRGDLYRQMLYYLFYNKGWISENIFSYLCEDHLDGEVFKRDRFDALHQMIQSYDFLEHKSAPCCGVGIKDDRLYDRYARGRGKIDPTWLVERNWYDETFCSIVIETDAGDRFPNLSEKTFRSIAMMHPLILFGSVGTLEQLSKMGLDLGPTMQAWESAKPTRVTHFFNKLEAINNQSIEELKSERQSMEPALKVLRREYSKLHGKIGQREQDIYDQIIAKMSQWGF